MGKWPRVSILGLIAAVVACGVIFAALRSGSDYWLGVAYTMTVALLLAAVVMARYRRGASRAFWFGFAVFGWGMFLLGTNPWETRPPSAHVEVNSVMHHQSQPAHDASDPCRGCPHPDGDGRPGRYRQDHL